MVRYDSGFAPNPFGSFCTLATCKASIRRSAKVGDWLVGSGSNAKAVLRGGYLVYAMRVTEAMGFQAYNDDPRFSKKKPYRRGSRKQSCGDNIYFHDATCTKWLQRDSFHSNKDGGLHPKHMRIDTGSDRVLISDDYVYFGGYGPAIPKHLRNFHGLDVCKSGRGYYAFENQELIAQFVHWIRSLGMSNYQGAPFEWRMLRGQ
ncbi:Nmad2 family putative nucleotide modification protein [Castellaniella sp. UC4447_H14]